MMEVGGEGGGGVKVGQRGKEMRKGGGGGGEMGLGGPPC